MSDGWLLEEITARGRHTNYR